MNIGEKRAIAMGAVRSQLRSNGKDPISVSMLEIEDTLDYLSRCNPRLIASQWYQTASKHQWELWRRDWKHWKRKQSLYRGDHANTR